MYIRKLQSGVQGCFRFQIAALAEQYDGEPGNEEMMADASHPETTHPTHPLLHRETEVSFGDGTSLFYAAKGLSESQR